jgi:DNA-binding response OmpR family regulator
MVPLPPRVPGNPEKVLTSKSEHTILFADDNEDFQKPVAALLYRSGYGVITANDGKHALQKAREFDGTIHLLLSDIEMPRMTGIELSTQLNQERPDTRILLISGVDSGLLVRKLGWQFLRKPLVFDTLRDRIRDLLAEQPSKQEQLPDA